MRKVRKEDRTGLQRREETRGQDCKGEKSREDKTAKERKSGEDCKRERTGQRRE